MVSVKGFIENFGKISTGKPPPHHHHHLPIKCFSLCLKDKESMIQVLRAVDKANGYCFGNVEERNLQAMMSAAVGADFQFSSYPFPVMTVTHSDSCG